MKGKELTKINGSAQKALAQVGIDIDAELADMQVPSSSEPDLPRIRIEHSVSGNHRLYIDYGESYLAEANREDIKDNTFQGVVFAHQSIRALWQKGEKMPICAGIEGMPSPRIRNPISPNCNNCAEAILGEGRCKPKIRLWLLKENKSGIQPYIFNLSPTSIKHWTFHLKKLRRSKLPIVAVNTVFSLDDIQKEGYRWAEVLFDINGVASTEMLSMAKKARDEIRRIVSQISEKDFADPGDMQSSDVVDIDDSQDDGLPF